jgi:hypothetical protein
LHCCIMKRERNTEQTIIIIFWTIEISHGEN